MHAYELRIPRQAAVLPQTIKFDARDDGAAEGMVRAYYGAIESELWHGGRIVRRFGKPRPQRLGEPSSQK